MSQMRAFGAQVQPGGGTVFRLWAPSAKEVALELDPQGAPSEHAMQASPDGWHEVRVAGVRAGTRYQFAVDDGKPVPDPASCYNPLDVHGPSEVVDPERYAWRDAAWRGRPWHEAVVYELHIGAFTPEGTYTAAIDKLAGLAALGITAIELMPLADMPGTRNWGYDGVLPYAPDAAYGTPDELRALIDHAHGLGMMVLLDAVYNHFGPDGNYLHGFCPEFFNPKHQTPWGAAINFDGPHNAVVRQFFIENALYWIEDFHFDGLRLDAVHQIRDDSARHLLQEIAERIHAGPGRERHVHIVLENEFNQASRLERDSTSGAPQCATAQWNDDFHHCAHVLLTGESEGYYLDYGDDPLKLLAQSLAEGFVYQGQGSPRDANHLRGEPSGHLPPVAFVSFLQNHDQIGNRAMGERLDQLVPAGDEDRLDALYACLLLSPHVPMLFMGEEFAATTPFLYFCDFDGELAEAVSKGRRAEFAYFKAFADEEARALIPDPNADETFAMSKLRWSERQDDTSNKHGRRLALVRELLSLRHKHLVPLLAGAARGGEFQVDGGLLQVSWTLGHEEGAAQWKLTANLGREDATGPAEEGSTIYACGTQTPTADGIVFGPNAVRVALQRP
jgi:maltooligosyltrehalose trehalohydrolase